MLALPIFPTSHPVRAEVSLTSVFGMGTGGPSPQSTPTIYMLTAELKTLAQSTQHKMCGDPYRIRTDVNGVRGHCLNHLTNGPCPASSIFKAFWL